MDSAPRLWVPGTRPGMTGLVGIGRSQSPSLKTPPHSPHPIAREGAWPATDAAVGCGRVGNRARSCGECGEGVTRRVRGLLSLEKPAHRRRGPVTGASRAGQLPLQCVEVRVSPKTAACRTLADNGRAERRASPKHTTTHGIRAQARRSAALPSPPRRMPMGRCRAGEHPPPTYLCAAWPHHPYCRVS